MLDKWISKAMAQELTGKSPRTIERWMASNANSCQHGQISSDALKKDYPFLAETAQTSHDAILRQDNLLAGDKVNTKLSLENAMTCIDALERQLTASDARQKDIIFANKEAVQNYEKQLQSKDWQIRTLINKRSRLPLWLNIGYILLIAAILYGLWIAFNWFRYEQSNQHSKELQSLKETARMEIYNLEESADRQAQIHRESIRDFQNKINSVTDIKNAEISALKDELSEIKESMKEKEK